MGGDLVTSQFTNNQVVLAKLKHRISENASYSAAIAGLTASSCRELL
jgi:hypothetical protein